MRYLLLIYTDEGMESSMTPEQQGVIYQAYNKYTTDLNESGKMLGGEALQPTATATAVQVRNGETLITDGPHAETKEQLGGFYMVNADDLDDAIAWAAKIPGAEVGTIEVRPIMEFEDPS